MSVFRCGSEPGARQSTVPRESCGEQANEVSGQMMALSCCPREAMAQRASCRVLSVLCVCPALSATKGSLARQRRGIRWTRPLLPASAPCPPPPEKCELQPSRAVSLFERLVGSCPAFETWTNKCYFIRFPFWLLSICLSLFSVCLVGGQLAFCCSYLYFLSPSFLLCSLL